VNRIAQTESNKLAILPELSKVKLLVKKEAVLKSRDSFKETVLIERSKPTNWFPLFSGPNRCWKKRN
jgi:hypothetical protein